MERRAETWGSHEIQMPMVIITPVKAVKVDSLHSSDMRGRKEKWLAFLLLCE